MSTDFTSSEGIEEQVDGVRHSGGRVFTLQFEGYTQADLFNAVRHALPLEPPISEHRHNWDALDDSLWEGLSALEEHEILLVWHDAQRFFLANPVVFETARGLLAGMTAALTDPTYLDSRTPKALRVLYEAGS